MQKEWIVAVLRSDRHFWRGSLISFGYCLCLLSLGQMVQAQAPAKKVGEDGQDQVLVQMYEAYENEDHKTLRALMPQAIGHVLEPWAAYWDLSTRLEGASSLEVQQFLQRYAGSYQEDRLRNDWMLLLGEREQWTNFLSVLAGFRMNDDPNVVCYEVSARGIKAKNEKNFGALVLQSWEDFGGASDACRQAATQLFKQRSIQASDLWYLARLGVGKRDLRWVQQTVGILVPKLEADVVSLMRNPGRYLKKLSKKKWLSTKQQEMAVLALTALTAKSRAAAVKQMKGPWRKRLSSAQAAWVWGRIGKSATFALNPKAFDYFVLAKNSYLNDDFLQWKVRAALRAARWDAVLATISAMTKQGQNEGAWKYWKARALQALGHKSQAQKLLMEIAANGHSVDGFYEQLALEALGESVRVPPIPGSLDQGDELTARTKQGLQRALYAFHLGLRSAGVREWNYEVNLHTPGGMSDQARLLASDLACAHAVWDRCINTSVRTQGFFHAGQRFPMPYQETVVKHAKAERLSLADVYGLIRQESRFIVPIQSSVGASGLMQVMKETARFVAKKKQITGYRDDLLTDLNMNLQLGTAYLKMLMNDFQNSKPLVLAAYNAGPSRARKWRAGASLESAIWVETIPFSETREYVKRVLANSVFYAALLGRNSVSIKAQLGSFIGPRDPNAPAEDQDLP